MSCKVVLVFAITIACTKALPKKISVRDAGTERTGFESMPDQKMSKLLVRSRRNDLFNHSLTGKFFDQF
jgi:hypothetical protein